LELGESEGKSQFTQEQGISDGVPLNPAILEKPMATLYLPCITRKHYDALRCKLYSFPANSYDEWTNLQPKEIADWEGRGGNVILVEIGADDFVRSSNETGAGLNMQTAKAIAFAKGTGKLA
jgi:hypothetical protein